MNDIEILVRDVLRYEGGLVGLESENLIRRARRRRLAHRLGAGTAIGALGLTAFATWASWTHVSVGDDVAGPGESPSASDAAPVITSLKARDRLTTPEGAVIVVNPDKLCVGNAHEKPSCLIGEDPRLSDDQTTYSFYTQSTEDFVYAWLVPEDSAQATLQVGGSAPQQATLIRVQGRKLLIAVVTGAHCWSSDTRFVQLATDSVGGVTYERDRTGAGTCQ